MFSKIVFNFSKITSRDTMPKILKHPRFTRTGVSKKKVKAYEYDLDQPHIQSQKHLFFNASEHKKAQRERRKQNKILNSPYEIVSDLTQKRDPKLMLQELFDADLLQKPSARIINNIVQLQALPDAQENVQVFADSLQKVNLEGYNFRNFGIFVNLAQKYLPENQALWQKIVLNFLRNVEKREYVNESYLQSTKKQLSNFIYLYNACYKACQQFEFSQEQNLIQKASEAYFLDNFQSIPDMNERTLFLSTLAKNLNSQDANTSDFIQIAVFNHVNIQELNINTLLALTHMLYKQKIQVTSACFQEIEGRLLALQKEITPGMFAVYVLSLGNLLRGQKIYSKNLLAFIQENAARVQELKDIAFVLEGVKKIGVSEKALFEKYEPLVQAQLEKNTQDYRLLAQLLRGCKGNNRFSEDLVRTIVNQIDQQHENIRNQDKLMLKNTLSRFASFVDLEALQLQSILFAQKK